MFGFCKVRDGDLGAGSGSGGVIRSALTCDS